jgi:hypothetical protein
MASEGGPAAAKPAPIAWSDAPVILNASRDYTTGDESAPEVTSPTPVAFAVPGDIYVQTGNASNGQAQFKFLGPSGVVTCTYQGGASTAHPTTDLDQMHGRRYRFAGCDNGDQAGQAETSTWFSFQILGGDSQDPSGITAASLQLGGGCSDQIPAPLDPDEVVGMRDGFTWDTVDTLPARDVDGNPALFHGLIYIESSAQLQALDQMRVLWSVRPLSERYMAGLRGKCGRVEHATDGKGVVVYAVFPAQFYNLMREFGIQAIHQNVAPPFRFIIPSPPDQPEYINADGSIKYAALASSGYAQWLASRSSAQPSWNPLSWPGEISDAAKDAYDWTKDNVVDPAAGAADDLGETALGVLNKGWDSVVEFSVNFLNDAWDETQNIFYKIAGLIGDEVDVHLKVTMMNRDPQFAPGSPFVRLWGPANPDGSRPPVVPVGAHLRIYQWGWGFLPLMNEAAIADTGDVHMTAIKGAADRNSDVCIQLDTDYASITSSIPPSEVCDFSSMRYGNFAKPIDDELAISQPDLFSLTQIKDSSDYYRTVIGSSPHTFKVLTGWLANNLTTAFANQPRAMTLCLDFPGTGSAALTAALTVAPVAVGGVIATKFNNPALGALAAVLGPLAGPLVEKDLWWPDSAAASKARDARGVMSHEYGHFVMCSLLYDQDGPPALTGLMARLGEGQDDSRSDVVTEMTEAWADTFAMQVTGGTNYIQSANSSGDAEIMHYCTASPCMDENYTGTNDYSAGYPFLDELARFEGLFYDAFDRSDSIERFTNAPGNGDILSEGPTGLGVSPVPYIANQDENVSLSGRAWRSWVQHWLERGRTPNPANVVGGLVQTMADYGFNWCDRCELVALHSRDTAPSSFSADPTGASPPTFSQRQLRWQACATSPELQSWVGPAPAPRLNMTPTCTPCPLHNFVDSNGVCQPCGPNEVARGGSCQTCGTNFASSDSEECIVG